MFVIAPTSTNLLLLRLTLKSSYRCKANQNTKDNRAVQRKHHKRLWCHLQRGMKYPEPFYYLPKL